MAAVSLHWQHQGNLVQVDAMSFVFSSLSRFYHPVTRNIREVLRIAVLQVHESGIPLKRQSRSGVARIEEIIAHRNVDRTSPALVKQQRLGREKR